jgi:hypothetical protein
MDDVPTIPYTLDYLFSYRLNWRLPLEAIGPVPAGLRVNFYITGGEIAGPRLTGKVLPVGAEFLTVRQDGVGILDMRTTFEADDGALIYAPFPGVLDFGEDGFQSLLAGDQAQDGTPFRSAPQYQTAHPDYQWLNRLQCVGIGQVFPSRAEARCDIYALC